MTFNINSMRLFMVVLLLIFLAGCRASGNRHAPIEDREAMRKEAAVAGKKPAQNELDTGTRIYVIQKGDTLYSIAFDNGLDYREVAEQNNIENPSAIQIGQQIKLQIADGEIVERSRVETKPLLPTPQIVVSKKDQPKVAKLPYSEQALLQIENLQQESSSVPTPIPTVTPVVATTTVKPLHEVESGTDEIEWGIPTKGKVIGEFSESASRKGVDIAGSKGQAVVASAAGKVVYSGSGLRGYGKLVIIKHNKTFLSAYAHNEQILVKEGQAVVKGQKIAEMGSTDSDQVKLHFEIRKFGKPVDPAKFLNLAKS